MKKILLVAAGIVFSFAIANAQTDTTKVVPFTTRKADADALRSTSRPVADPSKDMIKVPADQIPLTLRSTLEGNEYTGWENNGVVYQNPGTSEYALKINSSSSSTSTTPIWYYFDPSGKKIPDLSN